MARKPAPPPLTHEERQALIRRPITITSSGGRSWGGSTTEHLDTNTRRPSAYYDQPFAHKEDSDA